MPATAEHLLAFNSTETYHGRPCGPESTLRPRRVELGHIGGKSMPGDKSVTRFESTRVSEFPCAGLMPCFFTAIPQNLRRLFRFSTRLLPVSASPRPRVSASFACGRNPRWALLAALVFAAGCRNDQVGQPVKTQPADSSAAQMLPPPAVPPAATKPADEPTTDKPIADKPPVPPMATQPAKPESTYDSQPPYPVDLYVQSPEEKQPGWLKILALTDEKELATSTGRFPEQNRINVETRNVSRIRIHVSHLPLSPSERLILQIDGQGMVLNRKREYAVLERRSTGEWDILPERDD